MSVQVPTFVVVVVLAAPFLVALVLTWGWLMERYVVPWLDRKYPKEGE